MGTINGKVAVITGSTRGFGYAAARELLQAGASVVLCGRSQVIVDQAILSLSPSGPVSGLACDVRIPDQVYSLARFTVERHARIDIWINNAGITPPPGGIADFSPEEALAVYETNALGTYNGTQAALYYMKQQGSGQLVNLYGRGSDLQPASPTGLYGATKAWITSFTRTLGVELKDSGIQVIGFSPGMMLTDMLEFDEVIGEHTRKVMRVYPLVLQAISHPPEFAARRLVSVLVRSRKPFVEHQILNRARRFARGLKLVWLLINRKKAELPEYRYQEPFLPPVE